MTLFLSKVHMVIITNRRVMMDQLKLGPGPFSDMAIISDFFFLLNF